METLVRARNLESICFEIKKFKFSAIRKIQIDIVKLFCKLFAEERNTYVSAFVSSRLHMLSTCNGEGDLFHKLITEVYILFATINHPLNTMTHHTNKKTIQKSIDVNQMKNTLTLLRSREETHACIDQLYNLDSAFLWQFVRSSSSEKRFCRNLEYIYDVSNQKILLFAAYNSFYLTFTYSSSIYKNIVFQCMLKIPFLLHEDEAELNVKFHKTCLSYVPHIDASVNTLYTNTHTHSHSHTNTYTQETKTVKFKQNVKKGDTPRFEKVSSDSSYAMKEPMN